MPPSPYPVRIPWASLCSFPSTPVLLMRSLPARSTRCSFARNTVSLSGFVVSTHRMNMQWLRVDASFIGVSATCRGSFARLFWAVRERAAVGVPWWGRSMRTAYSSWGLCYLLNQRLAVGVAQEEQVQRVLRLAGGSLCFGAEGSRFGQDCNFVVMFGLV